MVIALIDLSLILSFLLLPFGRLFRERHGGLPFVPLPLLFALNLPTIGEVYLVYGSYYLMSAS